MSGSRKSFFWTVLLVSFAASLSFPLKSYAQFHFSVGGRIQASGEDHRTSEMVCSVSLFFSVDREERFDVKNGPQSAKLDGRGLLNCKNDQGFTTELPVLADLEADLPALTRIPSSESTAATAPGEVSFSANSGNFVIPREVSQIYDTYTVGDFSWDKTSTKSGEVALTFRGQRNDLVVGMKLNSRSRSLDGIKVKSMRLSFDEAAPDLGSP